MQAPAEPETVNERRASAGLEPLEAHLERMRELYGPPKPVPLLCPTCGSEVEVWLPEVGGRSTVQCPTCQSVTTIRARIKARPGVDRHTTREGEPR